MENIIMKREDCNLLIKLMIFNVVQALKYGGIHLNIDYNGKKEGIKILLQIDNTIYKEERKNNSINEYDDIYIFKE